MPDPLGPITAGRRGEGLVTFRVGPVPVTIHLSFLLVLGFLGINLGEPVLIATWVVVGATSVLLHELGHAGAAVLAGHEPRVDLAGMGGVTSFGHGRDRGRGWDLAITGAGPAVQLLAGLAVLPLVPTGFGLVYRGDLVEFALSAWVVVSLLWGGLNLVPILPLDGGQLFRDLVPGPRATRTRIAEAVSVALAGVGLVWGLMTGQTIAALLAGWFGFANMQSLLAARGERSGADGAGGEQAPGGEPRGPAADLREAQAALAGDDPDRAVTLAGRVAREVDDRRVATLAASVALAGLLRSGRSREAYRLVADPRHGLACNEVLVAHALARHPDRAAVQRVLDVALARGDEARARGITAVVALLHGHPGVADRVLASGPVSHDVEQEVARLSAA